MQEAKSKVRPIAAEINPSDVQIAKFWKFVNKKGNDECWEWAGRYCTRGYGVLSIKSADRLAHRISYRIAYGHLPTEMLVCHRCDNPKCVRPDHLFLGTSLDNVRDAINKGRACLLGEESAASKIKTSDVLKIRQMAKDGIPCAVIAKSFPINDSQVLNIFHRRSWPHIP